MTSPATAKSAAPGGALTPFVLALWQLRQTASRLILLMAGLATIIALVCTTILLARISSTAGLLGYLAQNPANMDVTLTAPINHISDYSGYQQAGKNVESVVQQYISAYLSPSSQQSFQLAGAPLVVKVGPSPDHPDLYYDTLNSITFIGMNVTSLGGQVKIIKGRLPNPSAKEVEIALSVKGAKTLNLSVGDVPLLHFDDEQDVLTRHIVRVHVVGIVQMVQPQTTFWQKNNLDASEFNEDGNAAGANVFALASDRNALQATNDPANYFDAIGHSGPLQAVLQVSEFNHISPTALDAAQIDQINAHCATLAERVGDVSSALPYGAILVGSVFPPLSLLAAYSDRINATQIPTLSLIFGMLAISLLFCTLVADSIVERQADTIAMLRGRGFSRGQIFGALAAQMVVVSVIALVGGVLAALALARWLTVLRFPQQAALVMHLLPTTPAQVLANIGWFAGGVVLVNGAALLMALWRATRLDVLELRRQMARSTEVPIWQRLRLDVIAIIVMVVGFGAGIYAQQIASGFGPEVTRLLVPLTLIGPIFFVLAALLLFSRIAPWLLRMGERLAGRGRAAAPQLALAQLARSPQAALRLLQLLALASAFVIVVLSFVASQAQRAPDVAAFTVGADFRGGITSNSQILDPQGFMRVHGVTGVSAGYINDEQPYDSLLGGTFHVIAIDPVTYPAVAHWPNQGELHDLLHQLAAARGTQKGIPALVNPVTWSAFHLTKGAIFQTRTGERSLSVPYVAIGEVDAIPMTPAGQGDILVEYPQLYHFNLEHPVINTIWLSTRGDAASLQTVRAALVKGPAALQVVVDRRAVAASSTQEPLVLTLGSVALFDVLVALLLAIIALAFASWNYAQRRFTSLALLRAIGAEPRQVLRVLQWEQGLTFACALALGVGLGLVLANTLIPNLVFTPGVSNDATASGAGYFALQQAPPVAVVLPLVAWLIIGGLALLCVGLIVVLSLIASRRSLGQALRLNED